MKCREAQYWLYSFRPNASWPVDVVGHLQQCPTCQQLQAKLKQIDLGIEKLTGGVGNPAVIDQLLERVQKTPQTAVPRDTVPAQAWRWGHVAAYLTGTAALILFGWTLGRYGETPQLVPIETLKTVEVIRDQFRDKIVLVHSESDRNLFTTLLKRNARLVQASQVGERLDTLLDMANDCRQHALMLIEQGPRDSLPLTIDLYGQLLRDGVLVQLAQAPAANRASLQAAARARLGKMANADAPPMPVKILADQRDALQNATQQTMERLDQLEGVIVPAKSRKIQRSEPMSPTSALIQFALTYSSEADPVVKADLCTDYVQRLMPSMMLYLADDATPQRVEMGQQFGEMIQFGIYTPLELASTKETPEPVKAQAERIIRNAGQAVAEIEENLDKAPDAAKAGLERALEATVKGWEKNDKNKGQGKGPPWKRNPNGSPENKSTPGKGKKDQKKAAVDCRDPVQTDVRSARFSEPPSFIRRCDIARL